MAGLEDHSAETEMAPTTQLKAGSVTKTVTATRVMQLVEAGQLRLDDPLSDFTDVLPEEHGTEIQHLLSHSSGLEDYGDQIGALGVTASWEPEELIAEAPLRAAPGTAHHYSNTNDVILSLVIEAATGSSWIDELNGLLAAQGISTAWLPGSDDDWGDTSPGYFVLPDGTLYQSGPRTHNAVNDFTPSLIGAAGAMVSDAAGLARWGDALWGGDAVLSAETRDTMETPIVSGSAYALGTVVLTDGHGKVLAHNGGVNGYESCVGHRPEDGWTLALLGNAWLSYNGTCCQPGYNWDAADQLWDALYDSQ